MELFFSYEISSKISIAYSGDIEFRILGIVADHSWSIIPFNTVCVLRYSADFAGFDSIYS